NFSQMSQDAIDPRIATDDEKAHLDEWKKYRVLVNRVDTSNPDWPEMSAN
ncbi:tail fiber assembly protein, partial [Salmonella enterica]|nr:tail fiber assembly protein [Salmonella enterica]